MSLGLGRGFGLLSLLMLLSREWPERGIRIVVILLIIRSATVVVIPAPVVTFLHPPSLLKPHWVQVPALAVEQHTPVNRRGWPLGDLLKKRQAFEAP
jgi:hypothetical protein